MAHGLILHPGGGAVRAAASRPSRAGFPLEPVAGPAPGPEPARPPDDARAAPFALPGPGQPTLSELFAAHPGDAGWTGFLLPQLPDGRPWLWVQERMAILESGRLHPPGLGAANLIHVEARDARDALWAMEEGLRCSALGAVIGELYGDPAALDFTATRRLAVAAERHGVPAFLLRFQGTANLSGARMRWRVESAPSLANSLNPKAPGRPAWSAELFRARGAVPGSWVIAHDPGSAHPFHLVAEAGDRAVAESQRRRA